MARKPSLNKRFAEKADTAQRVLASTVSTSEYTLLIVTALAVAMPLAWAYQQPPLPAFYSQALACALWAVTLLAAGWRLRAPLHPSNSRTPLATSVPVVAMWLTLLALALAHGATALSPAFVVAPISFNLLLAALLTVAVVASGRDEASQRRWLSALLVGVLMAALFNSLVALLQTFAPNWTNDTWIARGEAPHDRVTGNLRQPNQLATLVVWGLLAATYLLRSVPALWIALCLPLLATLFATGSRTGVVSLVLIVVAALLRSARVRSWRKRTWLLLALALIPLAWLGEAVFTRATADAALSQRLALWRDVIDIIRQHPWTGVGVGQLNFAWTLTPLAARAPDVFDHAHSLPLHLAAELGIPAALLIFVLLAAVLWRARSAMRTRAGATAALLLLVMLVHSLLEYPLWFSYFLMPSAFLLAWLTRAAASADALSVRKDDDRSSARLRRSLLLGVGLCVAAIGLLAALTYATKEYEKAAAIHRRPALPAARNAAVEVARASPLFGQFGDYAAIMLSDDTAPLALFARPVRYVLDERLLLAYARALARAGDLDRAAFVSARAREFPPGLLQQALPVIAPSAIHTQRVLGPRDFRP